MNLHHGASSIHLELSEAAQAFAESLGLSSVFERQRLRRAA